MEINETFYLNIVMEIDFELFYKYKNNYIKLNCV